MTAVPLISGKGLTKSYGNFVALSDANFTVMPGEVRGLIGSNGAGKSTLIKILTGAITPTLGSVEIEGASVPLGNPKAMINNGVACIYQHANLAPDMSVLDNIFLGCQPTRRFGFVDIRKQRQRAKEMLDRYRIDLDLDASVGSLSTVKQKEVEIIKALGLNAKIILMDEPTAWLSASEVAKLHDTVRALKSQGVGIVYISHVLDEIFAVCDTMTILRDGKVIAMRDVAEVDRPTVVHLMVGEKLARQSAQAAEQKRQPRGDGHDRLRVRNLSKHGVFKDISLDVYAREIVCITGLIGSKRTDFVRTLFGADRFDAGTLEIEGKSVKPSLPAEAMSLGIGFVPEDRHRDGLMLDMTVAENLAMASLSRFRRGTMIRRGRLAAAGRETISTLSIQPPDENRAVRMLSGGNQQKVLLGKWLSRTPQIFIFDEPTVGVDVGAKAEIYTLLRRERDRGAAIIVVSSDLEEVMTIADRIAIMVSGRLVAVHDAGTVGMAQIVSEIGGRTA